MTPSPDSTTTAFSARTRTTARRSGTTHSGSYVALSTNAPGIGIPLEARPDEDSQPDDGALRTNFRRIPRSGVSRSGHTLTLRATLVDASGLVAGWHAGGP